MNVTMMVSQNQLADALLNIAIVRPAFIWGSPGIGKSAIVEQFANQLGLPCVSLLGSQLAPEDIIGVPQIVDGYSKFCPPKMIARPEPYCLFLDELNACSHEVQKAFYSLIHERRIGEYSLPRGSIIIGAGNRAQDAAIVKPMSSALMNRLVHLHLKVSHREWLEWAKNNGVHKLILDYISNRPDHLCGSVPKHEEPFSTPRSWHMLSDALHEYGDRADEHVIEMLAFGTLSPPHAVQFKAFVKQLKSRHGLAAIISGESRWPSSPEERDILYFLAQSFRAQIIRELPPHNTKMTAHARDLSHRAKALIKDLAHLSLEVAQMVVAPDNGSALPDWFLTEVIRDLPRLAERNSEKKS